MITICNSKDFGVPQSRERVFIIGHRREECTRKVFPLTGTSRQDICQLKELTRGLSAAMRIYDYSGIACTQKALGGGLGAKTGLYSFIDLAKGTGGVLTNTARALQARYDKGVSNRKGEVSGVIEKLRVRKLTPLECFRLQGFPNEFVKNARDIGISDTQLYKQAGNSVTVSVVKAIAERLV